jgi:hypothetical protein
MFDYSNLVGKNAIEAYLFIFKINSAVEKIKLKKFKRAPLIQDRIKLSVEEQDAIEKALKLREEYKVPFWDSLFLTCFGSKFIPNRLLDEALFHQKEYKEILLSRQQILRGEMQNIFSNENSEEWIVITSDVEMTNGDIYFLQMLDFHCFKSNENFNLVSAVCKRVFSSSVILFDSGQSYHALGTELLPKKDFVNFLAKALLYAPIVDRAYIAHQLLDNSCSLRISKGGRTKQIPCVLGIIPI